MNENYLSDGEINFLLKRGLTIDPEDEIEQGLWIAVRDEKPEDMISFSQTVQDYTGWGYPERQ